MGWRRMVTTTPPRSRSDRSDGDARASVSASTMRKFAFGQRWLKTERPGPLIDFAPVPRMWNKNAPHGRAQPSPSGAHGTRKRPAFARHALDAAQVGSSLAADAATSTRAAKSITLGSLFNRRETNDVSPNVELESRDVVIYATPPT